MSQRNRKKETEVIQMCGNVVVNLEEWHISFRCDYCVEEFRKTEDFLKHTLHHIGIPTDFQNKMIENTNKQTITETLLVESIENVDDDEWRYELESFEVEADEGIHDAESISNEYSKHSNNKKGSKRKNPTTGDCNLGNDSISSKSVGGDENNPIPNEKSMKSLREDKGKSAIIDDLKSKNIVHEKYEVKDVVGQKVDHGVVYYRIRWKGYGEEDDTWEPEDNLDCSELLEEFKRKDFLQDPVKHDELKEHSTLAEFDFISCTEEGTDLSGCESTNENQNKQTKKLKISKELLQDKKDCGKTKESDKTGVDALDELIKKTKCPCKCEECGKIFYRRQTFFQHILMHRGIKPYTCDICGVGFRDNGNLRTHRLRHLGIKNYPCNTCDKRFTSSTELKIHQRIHTDERPYKCETCGDTFRTSSRLCYHRRTRHTKERPHLCNICGKNFYKKLDLDDHLLTHSGLRPYLCSICDMNFSSRKCLKQHSMLHAEEKRYKCKLCGKYFAQSAGLCSHVKSCHQKKTK